MEVELGGEAEDRGHRVLRCTGHGGERWVRDDACLSVRCRECVISG